MSNAIVKALEQAAERVGRTLSKDAGEAVEKMYRDAGQGVEDVVKRIQSVDDETARKFLDAAERVGKDDAGRAARGEAESAADSFGKQKLKALLNGDKWPPEGAPGIEARAPNDRHLLNRITPKMPKKPENSVILPHVDVRADVDAINLGQAERVGSDFKVNGRTYGIESNGTLFPRSGEGIVQMDRGSYWALQTMIHFGSDPERLALQMSRQGIGEAEQGIAADVYKLYRNG